MIDEADIAEWVLQVAVYADTEQAVVDELDRLSTVLGFEDSRYYDVTHCPFRRRWIATLRQWKAGGGRHIGKQFDDTTFENDISRPTRAYFGSGASSAERSEAQQEWVSLFGLNDHGWYDVPILDGDEIIGVWAVSKAGLRDEAPGIGRRLFLCGTIAGSRIAHLRDRHARDAVVAMPPLVQTGQRELVAAGLEHIGRSLGATFVAFYQFDLTKQKLIQLAEICHNPESGEYESFQAHSDVSYDIGEHLTGEAFKSADVRCIPSLEAFRRLSGRRLNDESLVAHEQRARTPITSLLFSISPEAVGTIAMIRVINRAATPELPFTKEQARLLQELAAPLYRASASVQTSEKFEILWLGFEKIYEHVRDSGVAFRNLGFIAEKLHVRATVVSVWSDKRELVEAWQWNSGVQARRTALSSTGKALREPLQSGFLPMAQLAEPLATLLPSDSDLLLVVPYPASGTAGDGAPVVVTVFVLTTHGPGRHEAHRRLQAHWHTDVNSRKALELIGRMLGVVIELVRNRAQLRLAEEAIGTIGHEARSPLSELVGLHSDLFDVIHAALGASRQERDLHVSAISTAPDANELTDIKSLPEAATWLRDAEDRMTQSTLRIGRVVSDAIRWARLGGESIEAQFEPVTVLELLRQAQRELRSDLNRRPWLRIVESPSVAAAPRFIGDRVLLQVLVTNLLDNAIKYSHRRDPSAEHGYRSQVQVFVEIQDGLLDIGITNWGLGIAEDDYENIFSSFYRSATRDAAHTIRGVGLGLPTCRKIAHVHGGSIRVTSRPTLRDRRKRERMLGFETTFVVRLPRGLPAGRRDINVTRTRPLRGTAE